MEITKDRADTPQAATPVAPSSGAVSQTSYLAETEASSVIGVDTVSNTDKGAGASPSIKKTEMAKNFGMAALSPEGLDYLAMDYYVDAKDQVNNWCVAQINEVMHDKNSIKIHFDGWSSRYDVVVKRNNHQKMAPFRSHTVGYTGQAKNAYREFKLTPTYMSLMQNKIEAIIDSKFQCFASAYECTQFIRGELFFYIDSFTTLFQQTTSDDMPALIDFMQLTFKLILTWMEIFPSYQAAFKQCHSTPMLYNVDLAAAISQCGYELAQILGKFFGMCKRAVPFFQHFRSEYIVRGKFAREDNGEENGVVLSLTNVFGNLGGFQKVVEFVKSHEGQQPLPLSLTGMFLLQFTHIAQFCDKEVSHQFASNVSQTLMNRLDNLTDLEIKEVERDVPLRIIQTLRSFITVCQPTANVYDVSETYELKLAKQYLMSPYFEKKIRGMAAFKDLFCKIRNGHSYTPTQLKQNELNYTRFLTLNYFAQWVTENQILEYIFTESPHNELIARSLELLYVRAVDKFYPIPHTLIKEIWKCCTEKHEDINRATLRVLQDLIQYLPVKTLEYLYGLISQLQDSSFDEMRVTFLKQYSMGALICLGNYKNILQEQLTEKKGIVAQQSSTAGSSLTNFFKSGNKQQSQTQNHKEKEVQINSTNYLNLEKFWTIGQENNAVSSQKTKDLALKCLIDILEANKETRPFQGQHTKIEFIKKAKENMMKGESVYTSVCFLKNILLTFRPESQSTTRYTGQTQAQLVNQLNDQSSREKVLTWLLGEDIFGIVIKNVIEYQNRAAQGIIKVENEQKPHLSSLSGDNWCHEDHINSFISLIEFIITGSKNGNLSFTHVEALFETFVTKAVTEYEQAHFFTFLTQENENSHNRERRFLLDERRRTEVFQKIMCNTQQLNCGKIREEGLFCFKMLFLNVNAERRSLDMDPKQAGNYTVLNMGDLLGFDTLWDIAIQTNDIKVRNASRNFLVDIFQKCTIPNKQKKALTDTYLQYLEQFSSAFASQGTNKMKITAEQAVQWRLNWLQLITTYIDRFDFEHIVDDNISQYDQSQNHDVVVTLEPDGIQEHVIVNPNQQIWQLLFLISKRFKLRLSEFKIQTKSGPLDERIYENPMNQYVIKNIAIRRVDDKMFEKENPRRIIGQNKAFLQKLVQMLGQMSHEERIAAQVTTVMESLPVNREMKAALILRVQKLPKDPSGDNFTEWCRLFSWDHEGIVAGHIPPETFNLLRVLHDLIIEKTVFSTQTKENLLQEKKIKFDFCIMFVKQGGFNFIVNFFNQLEKTNLDTSTLRNKALTMLLQMIPHFLSQKLFPSIKDSLTDKILYTIFDQNLKLIQNFIKTVCAQQAMKDATDDGTKRVLKKDILLISLALQFKQKMVLLQPSIMESFYKFPQIDNTLQQVFTVLESPNIQARVSQVLFEISKKLEQVQAQQVPPNTNQVTLPAYYLMNLIWKQFVPVTLQFSKSQGTQITSEMFQLAQKLLSGTNVHKQLDNIEPVDSLIISLSKMIQLRPIYELQANSTGEDVVLTGLFILLQNILQKRPEARRSFEGKTDLITYLLHDCLFKKETKRSLVDKNTAMPPKCKAPGTRESCLALVKELTIENADGVRLLTDYMRDTIYSNNVSWFWRTPRKQDWQLTSQNKHERASTGFVGLKNIGCICYMNSIMQQLYMIPSFRKAMLEVEDVNMGKEPNSENVLYQIKRIFGGLMELEKQYYNPKKFCQAFKDIEGLPIDPMVQRDVDEFFNMLIDRIENLTKGTKEEKVMKNLFYGVFANEFICKGCPHYSEREEDFMAIQLQVKNKHSVLESLDSFVEGEMLEGDNAYFCEKCEKKRDTLKRCTIKRFPNVLFLELKRFEFNFDTMQKFKVNDYCEFPMKLDMGKYSQEVIQRQDLVKQMEENNWTKDELNEDQQIILNRKVCPGYYNYQLTGVVVHNGTADSGHYYSFIKDREGEGWFEFNDTLVNAFDPNEIPEETFGGENQNWEQQLRQHQHDQAMQQVLTQQGRIKTKNAYILIYERDEFIDQERFNEFTDDSKAVLSCKQATQYTNSSAQFFQQCRLPQTVSTQIQITPTIHESILEKNRRFWLAKFIYNKQFIDQIHEIFAQLVVMPDADYMKARTKNLQAVALLRESDDQLEILKFIVTFCLTSAFRFNVRAQIPLFVRMIRKALLQNVSLSAWFIETFSHQEIIKEFFIDCPIADMSRFTGGLLKTAMQVIYQHEESKMMEYIQHLEQQVPIVDYIKESQGNRIKQIRTHVQEMKGASVTTSRGSDEVPVYSPCQEVTVITMQGGASPELPLLVMFINSFLHQQGSPYLMERLYLTSQFHAVVSHFADLGPVARLYLLKTNTMGRLLKIFLTNQLTPQSEGGHLTRKVPLFQLTYSESQQMYLSPNMVQGVEFKVPALERKQAQQTAAPPFTFLIRTISQLARSCQFGKPQQVAGEQATPDKSITSPYNLGLNQGFSIAREELDLIVNETANRIWWRSTSNEYPVVHNSVSDMFAHIAFDNIHFSLFYIKEIFTAINQNNFIIVKKYERPLIQLLKLNDNYQKERISRVLNSLYEVFKKNYTYWKFCDQLIELTYKLTKKVPAFAKELGGANNRQIYRMIESITKENPCFPLDFSRTKMFKEGILDWQKITKQGQQAGGVKKNLITQARVDQITAYSRNRLDNLAQAIQNAASSQTTPADPHVGNNGDDSDDDCYNHKFKNEDLVDVRFKKPNLEGWYLGKVTFSLDEMLYVTTQLNNGKNVAQWVETESYKLAWPKTYTKNEKFENHQFYLELYKYIEPFPEGGQQTSSSSSSQSQQSQSSRSNQSNQQQQTGRSTASQGGKPQSRRY